jgi:hypothetical protein
MNYKEFFATALTFGCLEDERLLIARESHTSVREAQVIRMSRKGSFTTRVIRAHTTVHVRFAPKATDDPPPRAKTRPSADHAGRAGIVN